MRLPSLLPLMVSSALGGRGVDPGWRPDLAPDPVEFTRGELARLAEGEVVYRVHRSDENQVVGISAAVTEVPPDAIWRHVLDFDTYVEYLPYITASRTVHQWAGDHIPDTHRPSGSGGEDPTELVVAELELTTLGVVTRYRMDNYWFPDRHYLAWAMVPQAANPLNAVVGTWQVSAFEADPERTLVVYRAQADMRWWVPDFLQERARERGLPVLVRLIRERAEAELG